MLISEVIVHKEWSKLKSTFIKLAINRVMMVKLKTRKQKTLT